MARLKLWTLVLICLALSGSPTIGIAAPKEKVETATAIRMTYSLAADQTQAINLPPNTPAHIMITQTSPQQAFTSLDVTIWDLPGIQGVFGVGFDFLAPTNLVDDPPYRVFGSHSFYQGTRLLLLDFMHCGELIVVNPTTIGVHNNPTNGVFEVCPPISGTITVIY